MFHCVTVMAAISLANLHGFPVTIIDLSPERTTTHNCSRGVLL